mmetsp:Transcript_21547/g.27867  ORF Transcript_21547/g.27867 Transcript_21547/m.27867 type:complete len:92 (-) Transcript_21547:111-386(-)
MTTKGHAVVFLTWVLATASTQAFTANLPRQQRSSLTRVNMVLEKPLAKKIPKIEQLKLDSDHLVNPLREVCFDSLFELISLRVRSCTCACL